MSEGLSTEYVPAWHMTMLADPWVKQYGTGYYWSAVTYAPRNAPGQSGGQA